MRRKIVAIIIVLSRRCLYQNTYIECNISKLEYLALFVRKYVKSKRENAANYSEENAYSINNLKTATRQLKAIERGYQLYLRVTCTPRYRLKVVDRRADAENEPRDEKSKMRKKRKNAIDHAGSK